jgi:hypothetical protein
MISKTILIEAIYNKTGIYITTKNDCKLISQLIVNEKIGYLSESTLYRFFLYQNHSNKPYKNTYSILAKFCGYPDWHTFLKYFNSNFLFNEPTFLNHSIDVVIKNFIQAQKFNSLVELFDSIEKETYKTKEFFGLKAFVNFKNTNLFPKFVEKFGDNSFVRNIIIESLYDPNHRINGYTEGIELYLKHTKITSATFLQDTIFANTVLFRYFYIKADKRAVEIGENLYRNANHSTNMDHMHIFPKTRFLAYKFWFLNLKGASNTTINQYFEYFLETIKLEIEKTSFVIDLNIIYQTIVEVFEALKLTEQLKKIDFIIESKLLALNVLRTEFQKLHNPNGILNLIA